MNGDVNGLLSAVFVMNGIALYDNACMLSLRRVTFLVKFVECMACFGLKRRCDPVILRSVAHTLVI